MNSVDNHTKEQRSHNMSMIRGKGTRPELLIHNELLKHKVQHKMYPKIPGNPDIIIGEFAVFVNGCFWHKCPSCFRMPKTNTEYWEMKINKNAERDKKNIEILEFKGYIVKTVWEHEIKQDVSRVAKRILNGYFPGH